MWKRNVNSTRHFIPSPQNEIFCLKKAKISSFSMFEMQVFCLSPCASRQGQAAEAHPAPGQHFGWNNDVFPFCAHSSVSAGHRTSGRYLRVQARWIEEETSDLGCMRADPLLPHAGRKETTRSHCSHGAFIVRLALASIPAARG